ncbi:helix-turn-helix transcriptional regulator [Psychrobium sp. 1_MG-2023]|uniref:helix-turn-helix transcriptional regulator n=1 Tax=Psychrobium sp. 1_MG-2023 TaxID=3062624 RepID=UPI000C333CC0|nr:helix-turn-helix transcriptional regulator [Psychrobium sp. 1_MG-2023]MDP2560017.1 helix-turn-helix transcriptional regulator [Psychrobium sp. 1_MG-2023]PKF56321.1 XRE family transcriptional regulator [Alteromonadales bacterium alter-6D02]
MEMKLDNVKLKQLRKNKAWSQSHLAEVSGVSLRTIQRIEKSGTASLESVKSICATFDIPIDELIIKGTNTVLPRFATVRWLKCKITGADKKAAAISFVIAFLISFYFST